MNTKAKVLTAIIFITICGVFGVDSIDSYRLDRAIAQDPAYVQASIDDYEVITKRKKGIERISYRLFWHFDSAGQPISGNDKFNEESGARLIEQGYVEIAYNRSAPAYHKLKSAFKSDNNLAQLAWRLAKVVMIALVGALLIGYILAWKFGWVRKAE